ncbi:MAG: hypothetical protein ABSF28_18475 [Terracidiphilus sp.]
MVLIEVLRPTAHLVRKVDGMEDVSLYPYAGKDLYCEDDGRRVLDPTVLFKLWILPFLY